MKLPGVRFKLRTIMVFIALAGVLLWGELRRAEFRGRAKFHQERESWFGSLARGPLCLSGSGLLRVKITPQGNHVLEPTLEGERFLKENAEREKAWLVLEACHSRLKSKYLAARSHPWFPVAADEDIPTEPK